MKSIPSCWTHNVVYLPQKHHSRNSYKKFLHKPEDPSSVKLHPQRLHISLDPEQTKVCHDSIVIKGPIWCYSFESNLPPTNPPVTSTDTQLSLGLLPFPVSLHFQLYLGGMLPSSNLLLIHPGTESTLPAASLPWWPKVCLQSLNTSKPPKPWFSWVISQHIWLYCCTAKKRAATTQASSMPNTQTRFLRKTHAKSHTLTEKHRFRAYLHPVEH